MRVLSYKELTELQMKVVEFKDKLRDIISQLDERGHRKLNPIFFLSGEVAAYKLLCSWFKQMTANRFEVTKDIQIALADIESLLDVREQDFTDTSVEDWYEECSQSLWYSLFDSQFNDSIVEVNFEIIELSWVVRLLSAPSLDVAEVLTDYSAAYDDVEMGIIYTETHNMIMNLEPQKLEIALGVIDKTRIYKLHFDMFQ